jgi:hypothetical protein
MTPKITPAAAAGPVIAEPGVAGTVAPATRLPQDAIMTTTAAGNSRPSHEPADRVVVIAA